MDVLVTYDINTQTPEGERRLAQVAAVCESYGVRMQYSVFECRVSETRLQHMWVRLAEVINPAVDSINIYRFPGTLSDARHTLGLQKGPNLGRAWLL